MTDSIPIRDRLRSRNAQVKDAARREVAEAVARHDGDVEAAARELGLTAPTVRRWSALAAQSAETTSSTTPLEPRPTPTTPGDAAAPQPVVEPGPEAAHRPALVEGGVRRTEPQRDPAPRELGFVLHTHLPWVVGHGTWPHGEDWLAEAVVHCYIPLIDVLQRLRSEGLRDLLTIAVSPVLASQLTDQRTYDLIGRYLRQRIKAARDAGDVHLAGWWADHYETVLAVWERIGGDVTGALGALQRQGVIEIATCAATHAYLPLTHTQQLINLQLATARDAHERWFGSPPAGAWLPECAYRPGGPWRHPVTGASEAFRPGVETFLEQHGIRWTVVDTHLALGGGPTISSSGVAEGFVPQVRNGVLAEPVFIGRSTVSAFVREAGSALQVWSRDRGYPGDPGYLDFHKRHWPSGLRSWRVTDSAADLADKLPYDPEAATGAIEAQADHFVELVSQTDGLDDGVAVCPFDTELFGHWWFEGPRWLEAVLRRAAEHPLLTPTTMSGHLHRKPTANRLALPEGSWGDGGDHRVWVNPDTEWMWHELGSSEFAVESFCKRSGATGFKQAVLNQLMILAASDWPFLVTTGAARDYAEERFAEHRNRLQHLLSAPTGGQLPQWARDDAVFPFVDPDAFAG